MVLKIEKRIPPVFLLVSLSSAHGRIHTDFYPTSFSGSQVHLARGKRLRVHCGIRLLVVVVEGCFF